MDSRVRGRWIAGGSHHPYRGAQALPPFLPGTCLFMRTDGARHREQTTQVCMGSSPVCVCVAARKGTQKMGRPGFAHLGGGGGKAVCSLHAKETPNPGVRLEK